MLALGEGGGGKSSYELYKNVRPILNTVPKNEALSMPFVQPFSSTCQSELTTIN